MTAFVLESKTRYMQHAETWEFDARYCPYCGTKGVWTCEQAAGCDEVTGICLACNKAWCWEYFADKWIDARSRRIRKALRTKGTVQA